MICRLVTAYGRPTILACDAKCEKAWGINHRPRVNFGDDPDDYAFKADSELDTAPIETGTWEGGDGKPQLPEDRLNKWCFRECERSVRTSGNEILTLPDYSVRHYNQPWKHK